MINFTLNPKQMPQHSGEEKLYYAIAQANGEMNIEDLAIVMARMTGRQDSYTFAEALRILPDALKKVLTKGFSVKLGDLGRFYITLQSEGVSEDEIKGYNPHDHITDVSANWTPGHTLRHLGNKKNGKGKGYVRATSGLKFKRVITRNAQKEAIRQMKRKTNAQDKL